MSNNIYCLFSCFGDGDCKLHFDLLHLFKSRSSALKHVHRIHPGQDVSTFLTKEYYENRYNDYNNFIKKIYIIESRQKAKEMITFMQGGTEALIYVIEEKKVNK